MAEDERLKATSTGNTDDWTSMDTMEKARIVKEDQGFHEAEISCAGEGDLHKQFNTCQKNPGHSQFIPIKDFKPNDLKPFFDETDTCFYDIIMAEKDMTARVLTTHTSMDRPQTFPNSSIPYPFYNYRGKTYVKTGTGFIRWVRDKKTKEDNTPCPCRECSNSATPCMEWGRVYIRTAQHVVFDTEEAQHTLVQLFYDDADNRDDVRTMYGVSVGLNILSDDWSEVTCVTHDLQLWDRLWDFDRRRLELYKTVRNKYLIEPTRLAVIISHPHGCYKQVTVGEWTHRERVNEYDYTRYTYTTPTCPGCSGAPVYILGEGRLFVMTNHPHSKRCKQDGLNQSGTGWD